MFTGKRNQQLREGSIETIFLWIGLAKALYWWHVRRKINDVIFHLRTKRVIYFMKIPFQLNCKLHNILMPLHMESNSCACSGVGIFLHKETSWKTLHFCVPCDWRKSFIDNLWQPHFSIWWMKKISVTSRKLSKKIILDPGHLLYQ